MARSVARYNRHHHAQLLHSRTKLKIGLVGGSFNPAHAGHIHMTLQAYCKLGLDQVWWLVSPQNPLKSQTNMASLPHRLAKARDITVPYNFIHVVAPEASLPSNLTYETVKYLKKTMPLARMTWIMGADNLVQLRQWQRYKSFISLLPIAVIDRPSYSYQAMSAGRHLFKRRYTTAQLRHRLCESRVDLPGWSFVVGRRHQASATAIRQGHAACHSSTDDK